MRIKNKLSLKIVNKEMIDQNEKKYDRNIIRFACAYESHVFDFCHVHLMFF